MSGFFRNPERVKFDVKRNAARKESRHVDSSPAGMTGRGLVLALEEAANGFPITSRTDARRLMEAGLLLRIGDWGSRIESGPARDFLTELGWRWCAELGISLPLAVSSDTHTAQSALPTGRQEKAA
jgi:hypothetical protein